MLPSAKSSRGPVINPPEDVYQTEVRIEARPETVFAYFTDPAKMVQWKGVDAVLDPRPGGQYRVNVNVRGRSALLRSR